jgi:THO complex subunit 3
MMTVTGTYPQPQSTPSFAFSNGRDELFLTRANGTISIVDFPTLQPLHTILGHNLSCNCVTHSPAGTYIATGASDALVMLWDTEDFFPKYSVSTYASPVKSVSFTFDGLYFAGGQEAGSGLDVLHVESGEVVAHLGTTGSAQCVEWHPNKYVLAYTGDAQGLKIVGSIAGELK